MITIRIPQTHLDLNNLIKDCVEENIHLDYKAADALQNADGKKKEIAKDVSAMANSDGGLIIYGIKEYDQSDKRHLPECITPIDRSRISKEWLEQVINSNISPKIDGLIIHPISLLEKNEVVYIVEIPKSNTAHQNTKDHRYYKRYNFEAVMMLDYEIRDIMNRAKHPQIEMTFIIEKFTHQINIPGTAVLNSEYEAARKFPVPPSIKNVTIYTLKIYPKNIGDIFAHYINYYVKIPTDIIDKEEGRYLNKQSPDITELYGENTFRDIIDVKIMPLGGSYNKYGPSRFDPILPGVRGRPLKLKLSTDPILDDRLLTWEVYADNASLKIGSICLKDIEIIDIDEE